MGELPKGWSKCELGELCLPVPTTQPTERPSEQFRYLEISAIDNHRNILIEPKTYLGKDAPSRARQLVRANDILYSTVRTYLKNIAMVPDRYDGEVASTGFAVLRAATAIEPRYLFYWVTSDDFSRSIAPLQRGVSYPAVREADVRSRPISVAPSSEQRRIVDEIEKQFTRLDAAVEALRRVRANLRRYRASVLKAACEGRLVPTEAALARAEGRAFESAGTLLQRILKARRKKWEEDQLARFKAKGKLPKDDAWKKKYQEPAAPDVGDLPELPEGWCWASVEQVADVQGGIQKQPKRRPIKNKYPFLRVANVYRGRLDLGDVHEIELFKGELDRLQLEVGDLLIVEGNGSASEIGRMAIWHGEIQRCVHQNHIIRLRPLDGLVSQFAESYWNSPDGAARVMAVASSTSGLHTLSVKKVNALPCPLAPTAEQNRIIATVQRGLSITDKLQQSLNEQLTRAERLRQAILKRAFEGRLVPQDPGDEPASVLLERIRAEREARAAAGKKTKRKTVKKAAKRKTAAKREKTKAGN